MKVFLSPHVSQIDPATGIGRVVIAQYRYLPDFGVRFTDDPEDADVIAVHTDGSWLPRVDVNHLHGLYWTGEPGSGKYASWHDEANKRIIATTRRARTVTVPSNWVAMPFQRDMRISPHVIGHGIDFSAWKAGDNLGYVLWNKNRAADVCDPTPAWEMAERGVKVMSTFLPDGHIRPDSMNVTGRMPFDEMKKAIASADVYLATTKETFGVGTLEAMACGVPVLGYNHGGTADIVTHKIDGYLVSPGDINGLMEGYEYIKNHRKEMSLQATATAKLYDWPNVIGKYAEVYRSVEEPEPTGVAVVIPCYNYAEYVTGAVDSALNQTHPVDEVIVVDDGSTDGSLELLHEKYMRNPKVTIIGQENRGVAAARNKGIAATKQPFIVCLDADDMLDPRFVKVCRNAMIADRALGVAYTGISLDRGFGWETYTAWPPEFSWENQTNVHNPPSNDIPSGSMFRRAMWERAGGYRQAYAPAEDTEFWTRGMSVGFAARKVTNEGLFMYRAHGGSASRTRKYNRIDAWLPWMRDKEYPLAAPSEVCPKVRSYSDPKISVIIPVGPGHEEYVIGAIESITGQTFREWEVIVVNDSGNSLELERLPFVQLVDSAAALRRGTGAARNMGVDAARADLVLFLDADDYLMPTALADMLHKFNASSGEYVYTDYLRDGEIVELPEYKEDDFRNTLPHAVTVLMKKSDALKVGGFDEWLPSWEDWDFFAKCAKNGVRGVRLQKPLLYYRTKSGQRRRKAFRQKKQLFEFIKNRYKEGEKWDAVVDQEEPQLLKPSKKLEAMGA